MSFGKGGGGQKIESKEENTGQRNPITWYKQETGLYPSNVQTWWAMKRPVQATPDNLQKTYLEVFDPEMKDQITFGNTLAPKGHYIFDAFDIDRSVVSSVGGLEKQTTDGARPKAIEFFAGRVFYAGTRATKWGSRIYFSQILERPAQVSDCHQQQDPTSEDVPDLLPSDGGVIVIPDIADVVKMYSYGDALYVFATNGVWKIAGSDGSGFKANDYAVSKLTSVPGFGQHSFVETDAGLLWWNRSGIWAIAPDQTGLNMQVASLSDPAIKDFFLDIPDESKKYAKGAYNKQSKIVQWIYSEDAPTDITTKYSYDRILNLDTRTGAFYPWRPISDERLETIAMSGIIAIDGEAVTASAADVLVDTDNVVTPGDTDAAVIVTNLDTVIADTDTVVANDPSANNQVVVNLYTRSTVENRFKYIILLKEAPEE